MPEVRTSERLRGDAQRARIEPARVGVLGDDDKGEGRLRRQRVEMELELRSARDDGRVAERLDRLAEQHAVPDERRASIIVPLARRRISYGWRPAERKRVRTDGVNGQ
eukprot:3904677-Prymnesium_polylepis.1